MPPDHPNPGSLALARLRRGVVAGCLIVAVALVAQTFLWSLTAFTEIRFEQSDALAENESPMIVTAQPQAEPQRSILPIPKNGEKKAVKVDEPTHRPASAADAHFATIFNLAGGIGRGAIVLLTVFIAIGVIVGVNMSVPGIDKGVGALMSAVLVSLLVLPFGSVLGFPWQDGALSRYESMTAASDAVTNLHIAVDVDSPAAATNGNRTTGETDEAESDALSPLGMTMLSLRYGAFPVLCILGVTWIGFRFAAAVEAAIQHEDRKLDPALEREASNITPTSLHGARNANHFSNLGKGEKEHAVNGSSQSSSSSIRQPTPGKAPARLI